MNTPLPHALRALTPNVHAWLPDGHATWGMANCVVVTGRTAGSGAALLVDTPYTAGMTRHLQQLIDGLGDGPAGRPEVRTVVNTHGNGDHSYGNGLFPDAEIIATDANGEHLCAEPAPADLAGLIMRQRPGLAPRGVHAAALRALRRLRRGEHRPPDPHLQRRTRPGRRRGGGAADRGGSRAHRGRPDRPPAAGGRGLRGRRRLQRGPPGALGGAVGVGAPRVAGASWTATRGSWCRGTAR